MDKPLDTLIALLPERDFYRANRQFIVSRRAVRDLSVWFGSPAVGQPDRQNPGTHRRQQGSGSGFQKMVYR